MDQNRRPSPADSRIYLSSPVNALVEGIYEENVPLSEVKKHGDFGLGTFNDLDGEMVMLDGNIYRIASDGAVTQEDEGLLTPFACVTAFREMSHDRLAEERSYAEFLAWLDNLMPSPNIFYAFRVEGTFTHVKVRSVPKQQNYQPLVEATRDQPVFSFEDIEGTLAGFFTPAFMSSLSVPGIHLHFLSADLRRGGHLLECRPRAIRTGIQFIYGLELALPISMDYLAWDFQRDTGRDLDQAEK